MSRAWGYGRTDRRRFLSGLTVYCAGGMALAAARAGESVPSAEKAEPALSDSHRSLSFLHIHTGERLQVDYYQDGAYQPERLAQVNYLLRDFRTNQVHPIDPALLDILSMLQLVAQKKGVFEVIS